MKLIYITVDEDKWNALKEVLNTDMLSCALSDKEHQAISDFLENATFLVYDPETSKRLSSL